jgi:hypothetical protein
MAMVCEWFGLKTTRTVFTSLASKLVVTVSGDLASKPAATVFSGLASKPAVTVSSSLASKLVVPVFTDLASKSVATVPSGLASKPAAMVSLSLVSKSEVGFLVETQNQGWWRVSRFGPQNLQLRFGDLGLKITATVSWFGPQNHVGFSLSVAPQNRRREVGVGYALRTSGLLHM